MKKLILILVVCTVILMIVGCGLEETDTRIKAETSTSIVSEINSSVETEVAGSEDKIDYLNAESFEKALNDGENVNGAVVQFDVIEFKPDSALGINCWSGEHLNFISETEPNVKKGDIVVGRIIEEPSKKLGSWKITYEVIEIKPVVITEEATMEEALIHEEVNESTEVKVVSSIEDYSIGDEIELGGILFNIYKIDDYKNELYLLAQNNVATTQFSESNRPYDEQHDYEGSLVEGYVNRFVDDLEDKEYVIKSSGIIEMDDLYELGFEDSVTVSGRPYLCSDVPEFVKYEKNYWLGGYYKVETYSWVYCAEQIDTMSCEDEYGVRPSIVIDPAEIDKKPQTQTSDLTIREIVDSDCAWVSEGGIENPYDRFYFDCENMLFTNIFESSQLSDTCKFSMEFIDEKTIRVEGVMKWYEVPAELTIVNENKLRLRFVDDTYNDGDYFLNKVIE